MLGDSSSLFGSTGDDGGAASGAALAHEGGGGGAAAVGGGSSSIAIAAAAAAVIGEDDRGRIDEFGERGSAGNRWPRQETLALLKIRSDMDVIFRDSSLKGPLWEEVSRKMAELGYHRSAKKCKEKFENVYKYHKRTKDGRAGKSDGKTYRFFDQLEAFENNPAHQLPALPAPPRPPPPPQAALLVSVAMPAVTAAVIQGSSVPVPSTTTTTTTAAAAVPSSASGAQPLNPLNPTASLPPPPPPQQIPSQNLQFQQPLMPHLSSSVPGHILSSPSSTPSSSSSTSSDEQILGRGKRKRKWKDFFERLMKEVIDKQEELQKKFLEAIEKREHDRLAREEAWKVQEMARLNREHEILVQERSMAAAKDAALIAFLQKISEQQQIPLPLQFVQPQSNSNIARRSSSANPAPVPAPMIPRSQPQPQPQAPPQVEETAAMAVPKPSQTALPPPQQLALTANVDPLKRTNGENSPLPPSPSRWPKAEVQALIDLRTNMDQKYQESGPKGPLWEEISASMRRLGYNRSAKRCKEKWENINKYFKKVKESNKKRPEDSKTCPYFHQLDAIYREKSIRIDNPFNNPATYALKSAEGGPVAAGTPIMARPEQQWPLPEDPGSHNGPDDSDGDLDDDDDDQAYEFVANSNAAVVGTAAAGGGEGGVAAAAAASMDNS